VRSAHAISGFWVLVQDVSIENYAPSCVAKAINIFTLIKTNMVMPKTSTINILIVDDTPDNLRLLAKILESHGYVVRKSLNGKMALQAAHRDPPNLILLDINMPEMNGYEVCQALKNSPSTCQIPIIFISALDQIGDKMRAFEMGGQDYVTKPFHELEVIARIKNQLLIQQQQRTLLEQQELVLQKNQTLQQEIDDRLRAEAEVRRLNVDLERRVDARTAELQQALSFELAIKRISDQVRDSLDQHQILQTAVETLAQVLDVHCCDAALYSSDHSTSTIRYQWLQSGLQTTQGQVLYMADYPELYEQLQNRTWFSFCQIQPTTIRNHSAILACPIFDHQVDQAGILGDLWLFRNLDLGFSEREVQLVQQAANQCAIALRQARLYEAAQAQVYELERLNHLKDDFLSTISHELRSPIASMKMILKLLVDLSNEENAMAPSTLPSGQQQKVVEYLHILQEECDRELALVEDLLHLQHIEAGTYVNQPTPISLQGFISHLVEPFESRVQNQQQTLQIDIAPDLPTLDLDPLSFNRVMTELLSNACKYTPARGTIAVTAKMVRSALEPEVLPRLQLTVTNTGIEIAPEELPRIFDKFYRIPNNDPWKHGGTGLGLALVKKLVEQMQGTLQVKSGNGQTCFVLQWSIGAE